MPRLRKVTEKILNDIRLVYSLAAAVNECGGDETPEAFFYKINIPAFLQAVDSLPEDVRKIVELRYAENITYEKLSSQLGLASDDVKQLEMKAINELKKPEVQDTYIMLASRGEIRMITEKLEERARKENEKEAQKPVEEQPEVQENAVLEHDMPEEKGEVSEDSISESELSDRTKQCLDAAGYKYMSELKGLTAKEIRYIKYLGPKSVQELIEFFDAK